MTTEYGIYEWVFDFEAWRKLWEIYGRNDVNGMAELMGVKPGTIASWRNKDGARPAEMPRLENLLKACNLFEIDPGAFFCLNKKK